MTADAPADKMLLTMNIACSTTVFSRMTLEEALSRISALGFTCVDLLMMENWAHINPSELVEDVRGYATEVKKLLKQYRLKPVAINGNVSHQLSAGDDAQRASNMKEAEALMEFAGSLKIPVVVLQPGGATGNESYDVAFEASATALSRIVAAAGSRGVTLAIETHSGSLAEGYHEALRFVSEVPGLKLAYDPSHFVMAGLNMGESKTLLPHTAHVHLRDAVKGNFQAPMAAGELDFMWVLEAIDASGYHGSIAIEYLDNRESNRESNREGEILSDVHTLKQLLETRYRHI